MIDFQNVSMAYGDLQALRSLSLRIEPGEFFALLGPNGAGKTTAIKLLTGLLQPSTGSIAVCGHDVQRTPLLAKAQLGYVPDVAVFYEKLTPHEFMRFIGDLYQVKPQRIEQQTHHLFDRFDLHGHAAQRIESLSHGTRQRLAIASALLHDPAVFVIDEPIVGLDPIHARTVKQELKERSRAGMTILMTTHLLNIAEDLADRIGVLHRGELIALGSMAQLRQQFEQREGTPLESLFLEMIEQAQ